jgi:hypothetical protein
MTHDEGLMLPANKAYTSERRCIFDVSDTKLKHAAIKMSSWAVVHVVLQPVQMPDRLVRIRSVNAPNNVEGSEFRCFRQANERSEMISN